MSAWVLYPFLGAIAGLAAGLLGVGGGLMIVPALIYLYAAQGFAPDHLTHMAVGTSLATMLFTSYGSIQQHHRLGNVDWNLLRGYAVGLIIGALLGAAIADRLNGIWLQRLFGLFAISMSAKMFFGFQPGASRQLPGAVGLASAGSVIGAVSALFGIGGGSLSVPYLVAHNVRMQRAVGTSAAAGWPIALAGALGFIVTGWGLAELPTGSTGYVFWPAVLGISLTSVICARYGARLAHRLPADTLKKIFASLLLILGVRLLMGVGG